MGRTVKPLLATLDARLATGSAALVVIDMQNDFCAAGGYVGQVLGRDVSACRAIVPALETLIGAARESGVPVLWVVARYDDDAVPGPMLAKKREAGITAVSCASGSWGAEAFGVAPLPGEAIFVKHTYSGFAGTELDAHLQRTAISTIVVAGVQTNVCVESTLRDGHARGYYIVVAEDCVASHMPQAHEATLTNVRFLFGDVVPSATIAARFRAG